MAKKKKVVLLKKLLTIGGILVGIQVILMVVLDQNGQSKTVREAIGKAVSSQPGLGIVRQVQLQIQAAIMDFRSTTGKFPETLDELAPKYFDAVPPNPETGQPFIYTVANNKYSLSTGEEAAAKEGAGSSELTKNLTAAQQTALIASLSEPENADKFVYDSTGKRDPFLPFDFAPKIDPSSTPLEQYALAELKVTAVLDSGGENAKAIVEDGTGRGYTITKGMKIGPNGGEVAEITAEKVTVVETETDFTGEKKIRTIELPMRRSGGR